MSTRHSLHDGIQLETQFFAKDDPENPGTVDVLCINYENERFYSVIPKTFGEKQWDGHTLKLKSILTLPLIGWAKRRVVPGFSTSVLAEEAMEIAIGEIEAPPPYAQPERHFLLYWSDGIENVDRNFQVVSATELGKIIVGDVSVRPTMHVDPWVRNAMAFLLK